MMDQSVIEVIAVEAGQVIVRNDGQPDRSCPGSVQGDWNAFYIRHGDGSGAWYGHLKNGSLSAKQVGDTVIAGEYLGLVGSSGFSTHPHLHFEYDTPAGPSTDPHSGSCRAGPSYWVIQRPYRDPRINMVLTHNAPPEFDAGCPNPYQETRHGHHDFLVGETMVAAVYLSDQEQAQVTTLRLFRPNGSLHSDWMFTSPDTYSASYWYWNIALTTAGLGELPTPGLWRFEAQHFNGTADSVDFTLRGDLFQNGFE